MDRNNTIPGCARCLALALGLSRAPRAGHLRRPQAPTSNIPGALPNMHLVSPVADGQWTMPAGDYGNTRFSPLDKINTSNVQNLHVVATPRPASLTATKAARWSSTTRCTWLRPFPNNLIALDLPSPAFRRSGSSAASRYHVGGDCLLRRGQSRRQLCRREDHLQHARRPHGGGGRKHREGGWRTQVGDIKLGETTTMAPIVVERTWSSWATAGASLGYADSSRRWT